MTTSSDRILTTHVGSLPRPAELLLLLQAQSRDEPHDRSRLQTLLDAAVAQMVASQVEAGVDIVNDGEMSKVAYTFYVKRCLSGIASGAPGVGMGKENADFTDHPDFAAQVRRRGGALGQRVVFPVCNASVKYSNLSPLRADLDRLKAAADQFGATKAFVPAPSPGILVRFIRNEFYPNEDSYLEALGDAMRVEYEAIHAAGFVLQLDCPDLASARHNFYQDLDESEFLSIARRHIDVLNHATRNIPPDAMRLHLCWGNYEGPHTRDIPFAKIAPVAFASRAQGISFEAANPRHAHEWEDLLEVGVPDDKILIPGVIDSTTNFVEHPTLVAQRLCNWAQVVGRERIIAGADCGFGTFASSEPTVAPSVVWAKFRALAEGADIASRRLRTAG
jgi:5-methyltetrahydropteroyltriglutamate--homocysteine methyltransferase